MKINRVLLSVVLVVVFAIGLNPIKWVKAQEMPLTCNIRSEAAGATVVATDVPIEYLVPDMQVEPVEATFENEQVSWVKVLLPAEGWVAYSCVFPEEQQPQALMTEAAPAPTAATPSFGPTVEYWWIDGAPVYIVNADGVNLREGDGTQFDLTGSRNNEPQKVAGQSAVQVLAVGRDISGEPWYLARTFVQSADGWTRQSFGWINGPVSDLAMAATEVRDEVADAISSYTPTCDLVNTGRQMFDLALVGESWYYDVLSSGCNWLVEGRKTTEAVHHIWIGQAMVGENEWRVNTAFIDRGQFFECMECSVWVYPKDWNMEDFSTEKPPIAAEFVDKKRAIMDETGYDWPIVVHLSRGTTKTFEPGQTAGVLDVLQSASAFAAKAATPECAFTDAHAIMVTGVFDKESGKFSAEIGPYGDCRTLVYGQLDEDPEIELLLFTGPQDAAKKVEFYTLIAIAIPASWDNAAIAEYVRTAVLPTFGSGTVIDASGISGFSPSTITIQ
jgi:hypothetical protein